MTYKMTFKRLVIVLALLALVFSAAGVATAQQDPTAAIVKEMVAKAKAAVKSASMEDMKAAIDAKEKAVILDVREPNEFAAGHLPGAISVPRGLVEFTIFKSVPDLNATVYVYCKTSGRSALATKALNDLGYKNAILADFQYADWVKAGYPVER